MPARIVGIKGVVTSNDGTHLASCELRGPGHNIWDLMRSIENSLVIERFNSHQLNTLTITYMTEPA